MDKRVRIDRIGETRIMNCGLNATIVAYRNTDNIDVQFENNEIVYNKCYGDFKNGNIRSKLFVSHIHETRIMNNGLRATIIAYRNYLDIDIKFNDNGLIKKCCRYDHFKNNTIKCPMKYEYRDDYIIVTNPNLNPQFSFIVDADNIKSIDKYVWGNKGGYVYSRYAGALHRIIMKASDNMVVDHIDGNPLNNRKSNLRICTRPENSRNQRIRNDNTSKYKGVSLDKSRKKWLGYIGVNGKKTYLGSYNTKEDAAKAYNEAAIKYHGEFAKLNKI